MVCIPMLPTFKDFLTGFKIWGLPATVAALGPWYNKIMSFRLVSEYWQPALNTATTTIAATACLAVYALVLRKTLATIAKILSFAAIIFLSSFLFCLAMQIFNLPYFFDEVWMKDLLNYANVLCYVLVFVCFSSILICSFLLFPRKRNKKSRCDGKA